MTTPFATDQALAALPREARRALCDRGLSGDPAVRERVAAIIARVRRDGDAALRAMAREFDDAALDALAVPPDECRHALAALDPAVRRALERAARNIAAAHEAWRPVAVETETEPGITIGRRPDPLQRVGVYAPGGRAAYPSSVLMGAIPARVAGVGEVIVCSPPGRDGRPLPTVLAAAALAGADRVFALGGAGAVAAMAYGTESVPRVDRIVGPGNAYVAEAKLQVATVVGIDSPAGPSELLAIWDGSGGSSGAERVARELLAQAEHDPDAAVVAVLVGDAPAEALREAVARQLRGAPREAIARQALASRGALLHGAATEGAVSFANDWAPEHLLLAVSEPDALLPRMRNAGTIFVGSTASVAFGDYMTGANHVLPTAGLARAYSGLSTLDFVRWTTYQRVTASAAARLAEDVATLANAEGLPAHAAAARALGQGAP